MPVTRKPQPKGAATGEPSETAIRAFIERGGSVSGEGIGDVRTKLVQLRLSPQLISRIDTVLAERRVPPSRHHWILEAIHEKLAKEEHEAEQG